MCLPFKISLALLPRTCPGNFDEATQKSRNFCGVSIDIEVHVSPTITSVARGALLLTVFERLSHLVVDRACADNQLGASVGITPPLFDSVSCLVSNAEVSWV
jgi:hypothetical protein